MCKNTCPKMKLQNWCTVIVTTDVYCFCKAAGWVLKTRTPWRQRASKYRRKMNETKMAVSPAALSQTWPSMVTLGPSWKGAAIYTSHILNGGPWSPWRHQNNITFQQQYLRPPMSDMAAIGVMRTAMKIHIHRHLICPNQMALRPTRLLWEHMREEDNRVGTLSTLSALWLPSGALAVLWRPHGTLGVLINRQCSSRSVSVGIPTSERQHLHSWSYKTSEDQPW